MNLDARLLHHTKYFIDEKAIYKPSIFDFKNQRDISSVNELFDTKKIVNVIDTYAVQLKELDEVRNPEQIKNPKKISEYPYSSKDGVWVYYPWKMTLVHTLNKNDFVYLRTSRNAHLITDNEQNAFANSKIGIAGLNVGNPGAICITLEGGGRSMKFADFDELSLSNLNRFRAGITELDLNKVIISARQAYEIDPFIDIEIFDKGITSDNIEKFLLDPKIDLLIEEMDNLILKMEIRKHAKKYKIPVLMVTAEGIIDVERYDQQDEVPVLNGHLKPDVIEKILAVNPNTPIKDRAHLALDFMGRENFSSRVQESFDKIGETLPSIPQLSEWTFLRGALLCHFARIILNKEVILPSGRYFLRLSQSHNTGNF